MKYIELFETFVSESNPNREWLESLYKRKPKNTRDYGVEKDSPFLQFPDLLVTRNTGKKKKGELSEVGEMVDFIFRHPGLSAKQLKNLVLGYHIDTPEDETYRKGGQGLGSLLTNGVLDSSCVDRTNERPAKYYALPVEGLTAAEMKEFYEKCKDKSKPTDEELKDFLHLKRGSIQGRKFNF
jgi:hypothetical protein